MATESSENERTSWARLPASQKSYAVRILDWFHYRRPHIARSRLLQGTEAIPGDMDGYLLVARELADRILTHPNHIAD